MYIYKKKSFKNNYEYRIRPDLEVSNGSSPGRTPLTPPPPGNQKYSLGHSPCKKQIESAHVDTSHSYIVNASPHDVFFSKESKTLGKVVGFVTE